ncbi:hypothetical protein [Pseudomonas sp. PSB11]|nr:hypothetical protein [Pseudomonas sp. PSB11]
MSDILQIVPAFAAWPGEVVAQLRHRRGLLRHRRGLLRHMAWEIAPG